MTFYALVFAAGVAGSFHCIGMCGGFACALAPDPRGRAATLRRHLLYNTGRLTTYMFIGAVAGSAGALVSRTTGAQQVLAIVSGMLMLIIGLQFLGYLKFRLHKTAGVGGEILVLPMRGLLKTQGRSAPLAFGVLNGFLPCPLVYAFAAQAAASGDPLSGLSLMAAFGLGTFPAMLLMGGIGTLLQPLWRQRGVRFAGVFIVAFGLITLARGIIPLSGHGHVL